LAVVGVGDLPGHEFAGVVREIALQMESYHGDVVYDVTVELTDSIEWGFCS